MSVVEAHLTGGTGIAVYVGDRLEARTGHR
jgi:hypothetical protein